MEKNPKIFLDHIVESISFIDDFISDVKFEEFVELKEKQDAIVRRLEIIGEAARNLPKNFKEKHSEIDWKEIVGMRDKIVHEYFDVDLKIVWDTVKEDLPNFRKRIEDLIKKL